MHNRITIADSVSKKIIIRKGEQNYDKMGLYSMWLHL